MTEENSLRGKKARADGVKFELKVRKDLEAQGWIVDKWSNNVDLINEKGCEKTFVTINKSCTTKTICVKGNLCDDCEAGKLIIAKRKYNPHKKVMAIGVGFPDFICFRCVIRDGISEWDVIAVEAKSAK